MNLGYLGIEKMAGVKYHRNNQRTNQYIDNQRNE